MTRERFKDFIQKENPEMYKEVQEEIRQEYKMHGGKRQGAGRKKIYKDKVKSTYELEKADVISLKDYAKKHNVSKNRAIHEAINLLIKQEA